MDKVLTTGSMTGIIFLARAYTSSQPCPDWFWGPPNILSSAY